MEGINKKYNLEIEVLTPLSIGAGAEKDWVRGVDFVVDNGVLYRLNLKKMVEHGIRIDDLTSYFASKNEAGLKSKLAGNLELVSDCMMPLPANSDNDVKTFVKNQLSGRPVLAGSSLKGAVRSVLFQYLGGKTKDGKEVFGSTIDGDEFMRFIKLSDAEFYHTVLVNTKIFNLLGGSSKWTGGWKHGANESNSRFNQVGFNTLYECLMPRQKGYASLMMAEKTLDNFELDRFYQKKLDTLQNRLRKEQKEDKQRKIEKEMKEVQKMAGTVNKKKSAMAIENLFAIINQHSKDYLEKEKAFFIKYSAEKSDLIVDSINALLSQIPQDNSYCLLKMSAGSGFHSITGDWQFEGDYTIGKFDRKRANKDDLKKHGTVLPKSRKIAIWDNHFALMGFVKLRALSEEDLRREQEAELRRREAEKQVALEEERQRIEAEAQLQKEKEEKELRYKTLLEQGEMAEKANLLEAALKCLYEAQSLFVHDDIAERIDVLKQKMEAAKLEMEVAQNQQIEAEQRRQSYAVPLAEKIANAGKLTTMFGGVKSWMKNNEVTALSEADKQALYDRIKAIVEAMKPREREKLKGFGGDLDALVGHDTAAQWFNEIVSKS